MKKGKELSFSVKPDIAIIALPVLLCAARQIKKSRCLASCRELALSGIGRCEAVSTDPEGAFWQSYTTEKRLEYLEEALQDVDLQNEMIVVSHNAELEDMDYNLRESTCKERGHYIGFARFGESAPNTVILYKTQNVPLFIQDGGGFPPDYDGSYR